ncbi:26752_t:CDS:2, partial [Gigaspora margarita]
ELQATINESKGEYRLERKGSIDIKISKKEEISSIIANDTNKLTAQHMKKAERIYMNQDEHHTTGVKSQLQLKQRSYRKQMKMLEHKKFEDVYTPIAKLQYWITKESEITRWWMIPSQKDKADRNRAKLKEIQEKINNRYEIIDGKQDKMLASLLDKPFSKIKIDRLVKEEEEDLIILESISSKLNFKAVKALEKLNIFYINQLIHQDGTMLATWGQLKLIKNATRKERKPIWFRYLELITLQNIDTRKIKDDLSTNADLKGLAILNLQRLSSDNRVKD